MSGDEFRRGLQQDLEQWRAALAEVPAASGFDTQKSMISSWIKEGQRLLDRLD